MSTHKHIDKLCAVAAAASLLLCILLMCLPAGALEARTKELGYESSLFDTRRVHTIDIQMDNWESFIAGAESEEYTLCTLVIDGETVANVGIRGKGNTSLSSVSSMGSSRYSFKVEFDQYDSSISYHGLDKLSLNNLIQDATYMKDYLSYRLMNEFGVAAPLCSFVQISVNGESRGLYLAVEGVENSFLQRNFGSDYGQLYKPDSLGLGGGRGNGRQFDMEALKEEAPAQGEPGQEKGDNRGSMAASDVLLQYTDDEPTSYSNIFNNAKTEISDADKTRLINSLKTLCGGENIESAVDIDAVIRYFVVHNFVVNGDSYTGGMVHNYYLYEDKGILSMIPWDYNLAFGSFQGSDATSAVNDLIDSPLSVSGTGRPMIDWIISCEEYTEKYHDYFSDFLRTVDIDSIITNAYALIAPYVQSDPTAFYSYEEFLLGVETLREFCSLRSESLLLQLSGSSESVDAGHISLSAMGSMNMGGGYIEGMGVPERDEMVPPEGFAENRQPTPPEGMPGAQMPPGGQDFGGRAPQNGFVEMPTPQPEADPANQAPAFGSLVLAPVCLVVLAAAIVIAWKYKR